MALGTIPGSVAPLLIKPFAIDAKTGRLVASELADFVNADACSFWLPHPRRWCSLRLQDPIKQHMQSVIAEHRQGRL